MSTSSFEASASQSPIFPRRERRGFTPFGLVTAAWNAVTDYRRVRRAEIELSELDDRMLRNIGITRIEIPHLARFGRDARIR
jgi:uncharacterized protein YjiS (DUF1127 family)